MTTAEYERSQFYRCYTLGHAWTDYDSDWATASDGLVPMTLRCERCATERREWIDTDGSVYSRTYHYPEGYQYGTGERPSGSERRQNFIALRALERRNRRQ